MLLRVIIVGGGQIGRSTANLLSSEKNIVSLIEKDESIAKSIAENSDFKVLNGDGTDIAILNDAGLDNADVVIAVTDDDKSNLMVCQIAKSNNIKKVVARVNTPGNEELFTKLGVHSVVAVAGMAVTAIKRELSSGNERVLAQLGGGDVQLIEVTIEEKSHLIGKPPEIKGAVIGAIYRNGEIILPDNRNKLAKGDVLILIAKSKNIKDIRKLLSGK